MTLATSNSAFALQVRRDLHNFRHTFGIAQLCCSRRWGNKQSSCDEENR